jgi:integrase
MQELLCLSTLAYLGPRRKAAAHLRRRDVDLERGTIRFREKRGKVITSQPPTFELEGTGGPRPLIHAPAGSLARP